ncbi:MAG: hypothetical protein EXR98_16960 [Gemmataceae bacterium]|nr:hypothetical protein [Gemmataceae bacterium]
MNKPTRIFVAMAVIAGVFVVAFFTIGPAGEKVYASPTEVFKAAAKASAKDDMKSWCQCVTDGSRDLRAAMGVAMLFDEMQKPAQAKDDDGKVKARAINDLFAKYRMSPEFLVGMQGKIEVLFEEKAPLDVKLEVAGALLLPVRDRNAFAADLHGALLKYARRSPLSVIEGFREAQLSDIKPPEGETAQGTMVTERGPPGVPIFFRKQGEGWRIDLVTSESRRQAPSGMPFQ